MLPSDHFQRIDTRFDLRILARGIFGWGPERNTINDSRAEEKKLLRKC